MDNELDTWVVEEIERARPALERYVLGLVRDPDEAADISQEAMVRFLVLVRSGRRPDSSIAWMCRVAHNLVVTAARRRSVATRAADRLVDRRGNPAVDDHLLAGERQAEVAAMLAGVYRHERDAILLAAAGRSTREIADHLGKSELATRALLCRARARVRVGLVAMDVSGTGTGIAPGR
jgi:RNA polymerase sigma factor (sigma-70 family)